MGSADDERGLGENGAVATFTGESRSMVFKTAGNSKTLGTARNARRDGPRVSERPPGIPRRKTHVDRCGKRVPFKGTRISTFRRHKLRAIDLSHGHGGALHTLAGPWADPGLNAHTRLVG